MRPAQTQISLGICAVWSGTGALLEAKNPRLLQIVCKSFGQTAQSDISLRWLHFLIFTGRGSSIGSESAWHASGPDPHVRHILSWRLGHENISTAILPLPLIQEEQLSVTDERMCTKYWKLPRRLARNSVVRVTDRARNDLKCVEGP